MKTFWNMLSPQRVFLNGALEEQIKGGTSRCCQVPGVFLNGALEEQIKGGASGCCQVPVSRARNTMKRVLKKWVFRMEALLTAYEVWLHIDQVKPLSQFLYSHRTVALCTSPTAMYPVTLEVIESSRNAKFCCSV